MAILSVKKNGVAVELPAPVSISIGSEILWSSNTGRISSGKMIGDVIAQKETLNITWGILTSDQKNLIKNSLVAGFFPITVNVDGIPYTIQAYRGTLTSEPIGQLSDGKYYYRTVSTDIVEQ